MVLAFINITLGLFNLLSAVNGKKKSLIIFNAVVAGFGLGVGLSIIVIEL